MNCFCGDSRDWHEHGIDGLSFCRKPGCTCDIFETEDDAPPKLHAQNDKPVAAIRWPWVW